VSYRLPKLIRKDRVVSPIVVGWLFVIALVVSFVGVSYVIGTPPAMLQHMVAASVSAR
jgi:hypothetical protein